MGRAAIYNTIAAKKDARRKREKLKPRTKGEKERRKLRKQQRLEERKKRKAQEEGDRINKEVEAMMNGIFV